jgi:hypothetical protein
MCPGHWPGHFSTATTSAATANALGQRIAANLTPAQGQMTEGVDQNQVASEILSLQSRLQASYRTTAMLSQLSLVPGVSLAGEGVR